MIILDTSVLSAAMRPDKNPIAIVWLNRQNPAHLRTTVISLNELAYGVERLPDGPDRAALALRFDQLMRHPTTSRILPLLRDGALAAAKCRATAMRVIGQCDIPDALIGGIALSNGASVATRNVKHFQHFGVPLINPWDVGN